MARQIAQKMLELGEPVEKIASITGLSVEEIRKPS
jgi:predicted transposase YdaD